MLFITDKLFVKYFISVTQLFINFFNPYFLFVLIYIFLRVSLKMNFLYFKILSSNVF